MQFVKDYKVKPPKKERANNNANKSKEKPCFVKEFEKYAKLSTEKIVPSITPQVKTSIQAADVTLENGIFTTQALPMTSTQVSVARVTATSPNCAIQAINQISSQSVLEKDAAFSLTVSETETSIEQLLQVPDLNADAFDSIGGSHIKNTAAVPDVPKMVSIESE